MLDVLVVNNLENYSGRVAFLTIALSKQFVDIPASNIIPWELIPDDLSLTKKTAALATSCVATAFFLNVKFSACMYESKQPGIPAEADVFNKPGLTELNRTSENEEKDFAKRNVSCINIAPGPIDTDRLRNLVDDVYELGKTLPMGRVGSTMEIGRFVKSIIENNIKYLTGVTINFDGGHSNYVI